MVSLNKKVVSVIYTKGTKEFNEDSSCVRVASSTERNVNVA